jgi:hypothetical protein
MQRYQLKWFCTLELLCLDESMKYFSDLHQVKAGATSD